MTDASIHLLKDDLHYLRDIGGYERVVLSLAVSLAKAGIDCPPTHEEEVWARTQEPDLLQKRVEELKKAREKIS